MSWTWLGLAVIVLLAFSMVDGYRRGFYKRSSICTARYVICCCSMADQSLCEFFYQG